MSEATWYWSIMGVACALLGAMFVTLIVKHERVRILRRGDVSTNVVSSGSYYASLALYALLFIAMVAATLMRGGASVGRTLVPEVAVLAVAYALFVVVYAKSRCVYVGTAMALFVTYFVANALWFALVETAGLWDFVSCGKSAASAACAAARAKKGPYVAFLLVFLIVAVLAVASAVVRRPPNHAFGGELAAYLLIPVAPLILVLMKMRGMSFGMAFFAMFVDMLVRLVVYLFLQFSGVIDCHVDALTTVFERNSDICNPGIDGGEVGTAGCNRGGRTTRPHRGGDKGDDEYRPDAPDEVRRPDDKGVGDGVKCRVQKGGDGVKCRVYRGKTT
jgi:hypothetical protein